MTARDSNRSLSGQGARVRAGKPTDLMAAFQELTRMFRSRGVQTSKVDSAGLNLTVIERRPTVDIAMAADATIYDVLGNATSSVITVPVAPEVDSLMLAYLDVFMDPGAISTGPTRLESWITVDGTSWKTQAAAREIPSLQTDKGSVIRLLCVPLRAGKHAIGWKVQQTTGGNAWTLNTPYTRLILILVRLDNADVVAKL